MSRWLFSLPWTLCFALGFCLAAVSPAVLVPSLMILIEKKYGAKKGIPLIMLAASSFDDIVAITVFGILIAISFDSITGGSTDIGPMIGMNVLYIVAGIVGGGLLGLSMIVLKKVNVKIKFILMLAIAISLPFITHALKFEDSKYVGVIFYGYCTYRVWGHEKPDALLGKFWKLCGPWLFGTIGASVQFSKIDGKIFGYSLAVIFAGLILRVLITYFVTMGQGFTNKERGFIAFGWSPKATVQAAIGGIVFDRAMSLPDTVSPAVKLQYIEYGTVILTTAVVAIIITAPLGAILINTLGIRWLSCDAEIATIEAIDEKPVEIQMG